MNYAIKLNKRNSRLTLKVTRSSVNLRQTNRKIILKQTGRRGVKGDIGDTGIGMPAGGLAGQIIVKDSDADYDYAYVSPVALADKNFSQNFTTATLVTVTHNLNKYPSVSVIDSAGDEVVGQVTYISLNQLTVAFSAAFSGRITCN